MPASLRANVSRGTSSSRPYDRRSPSASPAQSENPLVHPHLSDRSLAPASPIQDPDPDLYTPPDHPGLPTYADYKQIEAGYLHSLSPRKRDKALITQAMFDKIWDVLHQPDACTIETPQFRFWVRKMFTLSRPTCVGAHMADYLDSDAEEEDLELERAMGIGADASADLFGAVVLHENRPVAIMEQLYELFCYCHIRAGHGGRDKTCAVIRQHYSWVPKELTAQFVKACPTCALKRSGHGGVGVGVDMGVLVKKQTVGQRAKKVRGTPVSAVPSSLGSVGWPTTGGPLDPANPEPCGVRERERQRLRAREDARTTIGPSSPVSPASVDASRSRMRSVPREGPLESCLSRGWSSIDIPRALTMDASPLHLCDTTRSLGSHQPFAVENSRVLSGLEEERSPTRTTELPSLASALSNESLDENVYLTGLGPETASRADDASECLLPPALRPLRLSGPIPSDSEPDHHPHLFQIDPVLLSFDYPGLPGTGFVSCEADAMIPLALSTSRSEGQGHCGSLAGMCITNMTGLSRRLRRGPSSDALDVMPSLSETSDPDSSDSSFESCRFAYDRRCCHHVAVLALDGASAK